MNNDKRDQLIELFESLLSVSFPSENNDASLIEMVQKSLQIVALIGEQSAHVYSIAKSLSVVQRVKQKSSLVDTLRHNLIQVEQGLEHELRGLSCLLDLVLEETSLRINTAELKESLPSRYVPLVTIFNDLHEQLEAYNGFYLAFGQKSSTALTLMFLGALQRAIEIITGPAFNAQEAMIGWLERFVKISSLRTIFALQLDYGNAEAIAKFCLSECKYAQEILTVFLCVTSATSRVISYQSAELLNKALYNADLLGIEPFLESGFVVLELNKNGGATGI